MEKQTKITGWLWIAVLSLAIQPLLFIRILYGLTRTGFHGMLINYVIILYDLITSLLSMHLLYLMFKRREIFTAYFVTFRIAIYLFWTFIIFWAMNLPISSTSSAALFQPFFAHIITLIFIVPYLLLSRRVRETFTEPLDTSRPLEAFLPPLIPIFNPTLKILGKKPLFLFPKLLGVIILVIALAIVTTSIPI